MRMPALRPSKKHLLFVLAGLLVPLALTPQVAGEWIIDLSRFETDMNHVMGNLDLSPDSFTVRVPVNVQNMPANWRQADLVVVFNALFRSGGGAPGGNRPWIDLSTGTGSDDGLAGAARGQVTRAGLLQNGSYDGVVVVPSSELYGVVTNDMVVMTVAVAKKGNECLALGLGLYPAESGVCTEASTSQYAFFECTEDIMGSIPKVLRQ